MIVYLVWCEYDFGKKIFDYKDKAYAYVNSMIQRVGHEGEWHIVSYKVE